MPKHDSITEGGDLRSTPLLDADTLPPSWVFLYALHLRTAPLEPSVEGDQRNTQ